MGAGKTTIGRSLAKRLSLDFTIRVDVVEIKALGQRPAYGRFSGTHQPDEIEVFAELYFVHAAILPQHMYEKAGTGRLRRRSSERQKSAYGEILGNDARRDEDQQLGFVVDPLAVLE